DIQCEVRCRLGLVELFARLRLNLEPIHRAIAFQRPIGCAERGRKGNEPSSRQSQCQQVSAHPSHSLLITETVDSASRCKNTAGLEGMSQLNPQKGRVRFAHAAEPAHSEGLE